MNNRARYYIQILDKVATPLMRAMSTRAEATDTATQAQTMAELLAGSMKTSIALGDIIDIGTMGEKTDSMRVALAGLAAPLVATHFEKTGKAPEEGDVKALTASMQAALSFGENFTPTAENAERLEGLETSPPTDIPQIQAQYMHTLTPIVQAVQDFSFGHQAGKLVTDITSQLTARAEHIAGQIADTDDEITKKRTALPILASLVSIYTDCHTAETARIQSLDDDARAALPKDGNGLALTTLWEAYDIRFALLEILVGSILGDDTPAEQGADTAAPAAPTPAEAPALDNPMAMFTKKPEGDTPPLAAPEAPPPETAPSSEEPASANPMSMFAKKPDANTDTPSATPAELETPSQPAPAESKPDSNAGSNPMSFFSAPKDKESDE